MAAFYEELKRRNVVKVAAAYAAAAWLVAQITETVFPVFDISDSLLKAVFVILGLGFPVTVVLAWVYDMTPDGIRRTDEMPSGTARVSGRGLDFAIIACLTVAVLILVLDRHVWHPVSDANLTAVAVLPFTTDVSDEQVRYIGDGIASQLVMRLSRLPHIKVRSRSMLRADETDLQRLGQQMGVQAICRGSVRRMDSILEISVEIVNVADGTVIWSDFLQRSLSGMISIESDISAQVASALRLELTPDESAVLARAATENDEAYHLYLQGRHMWNQRSADGLRASAEFFRQAVDLDPGYALAWSGLADAYLMMFAWGFDAPGDAAPLALAAAQRAVELDPTLAEPWATIGYHKTLFERDWEGAREAFLRSIELNPNYSTAHHWYAFLLSTLGDAEGAIDEILKARVSEPLSPIINAEVGVFLSYDGQNERAVEELRRAQLWNPGFPSLLMSLARAHALLGNAETAADMTRQAMEAFAGNYTARGFAAVVAPLTGNMEDARAVYEEMIEARETVYIQPGIMGLVAAAIGDYEASFAHFERGLEERSLVISWLRDPTIADMREDPRYAELMERVGLQP